MQKIFDEYRRADIGKEMIKVDTKNGVMPKWIPVEREELIGGEFIKVKYKEFDFHELAR